jgi:hypothetical protein
VEGISGTSFLQKDPEKWKLGSHCKERVKRRNPFKSKKMHGHGKLLDITVHANCKDYQMAWNLLFYEYNHATPISTYVFMDTRVLPTFEKLDDNNIKLFFWEYTEEEDPDRGLEFVINKDTCRLNVQRKYSATAKGERCNFDIEGYITSDVIKTLIDMFPYLKEARDFKKTIKDVM